MGKKKRMVLLVLGIIILGIAIYQYPLQKAFAQKAFETYIDKQGIDPDNIAIKKPVKDWKQGGYLIVVTFNDDINNKYYLCSVDSNRFPPLLELWREEKAINHQTVLLLQVVNMKMKKLICVMALVCIGMLLVSCGSKRLDNPKAQFIRDFGLNIEKKDCVLEELFNNYEGVPYEGIALYKLTIGEDVRQAFLQWERFPFSEKAECFLESLSAYAELPPIADGYWKMRS